MVNLKKLDAFVNKFSEQIVELRKLENSEEKQNSKEHKVAYKKCISVLLNRKKDFFGVDKDLWKELYFRSLFFYGNTSIHLTEPKEEEIPIYEVTKHNEILKDYCTSDRSFGSQTILHFDTHSDLNPIENSAVLPELYTKFKQTGDFSFLDEAQKIVWDIGAAQTGILFTHGARDIIWCLPKWVPDKQIDIKYIIKSGKRNLLLTALESLKGVKNMDEWGYTESHQSQLQNAKTFCKVQTGKLTKKGYNTLKSTISKNGSKYILDIDLDYFVCNGKKFTPSYFTESYDLESHLRTQEREINQDFPRNALENSNELRRYNNALKRELVVIDLRVRTFLKTIWELRKDGLTPSVISICDSTNVLFDKCESCNSVSNGYVPTYLGLYLHTKLVSGLEKIFTKKLKERKKKVKKENKNGI